MHSTVWPGALSTPGNGRNQPGSTRARDRFLAMDDLVSAAASQTGLAACAERLGDLPEAVRNRMAAVTSIETMRSAQQKHAHQGEYFDRFGDYHENAIRTAVHALDAGAFISVFEGIAGRRLAGLLTAAPENIQDGGTLAGLVLEADARAGLGQSHPSDDERLRDRTRALGSQEARMKPSDPSPAFDDAVASLYSPFNPDDALDLWTRADSDSTHLLMLVILRSSSELAWLLRRTDGPLHIGLSDVPAETLDLVDELHFHGVPLTARPEYLASLGSFLPDELVALIPECERLLIIPAARLWGNPVASVSVGWRPISR